MDLVAAQYVEIGIFAVVVLSVILYSLLRRHELSDTHELKIFASLIITNVLLLVSDTAIYFLNGHKSTAAVIAMHICCVIYFALHMVFGYLWVCYCFRKLYPDSEVSHYLRVLCALPGIIGLAVVFSSPWTKLAYRLLPDNIYDRGEAFYIIVILSYLYWLIGFSVVIYDLCSKKFLRERSLYITLFLFPLPTVLGNLIQLKFYGITVVWICTAVSGLILFIDMQNGQLSRDVLTGLYNRRHTDKQLEWETKRLPVCDDLLYTVMLDIDNFKRINDQFGHVSGDKTLIAIASALKICCRGKAFTGRFGGDEFIIIGHAADTDEIKSLLANIEFEVEKQSASLPAPVTVSMGYVFFGHGALQSVDTIVAAADKKMYRAKAAKNHVEPVAESSCERV